MIQLNSSCISEEVKELLLNTFRGMDLDDYGDFLTELMNRAGYRKITHHLTSIVASFEPYMIQNRKEEFENMNELELEVVLVNYIKDNLKICSKENKEI